MRKRGKKRKEKRIVQPSLLIELGKPEIRKVDALLNRSPGKGKKDKTFLIPRA